MENKGVLCESHHAVYRVAGIFFRDPALTVCSKERRLLLGQEAISSKQIRKIASCNSREARLIREESLFPDGSTIGLPVLETAPVPAGAYFAPLFLGKEEAGVATSISLGRLEAIYSDAVNSHGSVEAAVAWCRRRYSSHWTLAEGAWAAVGSQLASAGSILFRRGSSCESGAFVRLDALQFHDSLVMVSVLAFEDCGPGWCISSKAIGMFDMMAGGAEEGHRVKISDRSSERSWGHGLSLSSLLQGLPFGNPGASSDGSVGALRGISSSTRRGKSAIRGVYPRWGVSLQRESLPDLNLVQGLLSPPEGGAGIASAIVLRSRKNGCRAGFVAFPDNAMGSFVALSCGMRHLTRSVTLISDSFDPSCITHGDGLMILLSRAKRCTDKTELAVVMEVFRRCCARVARGNCHGKMLIRLLEEPALDWLLDSVRWRPEEPPIPFRVADILLRVCGRILAISLKRDRRPTVGLTFLERLAVFFRRGRGAIRDGAIKDNLPVEPLEFRTFAVESCQEVMDAKAGEDAEQDGLPRRAERVGRDLQQMARKMAQGSLCMEERLADTLSEWADMDHFLTASPLLPEPASTDVGLQGWLREQEGETFVAVNFSPLIAAWRRSEQFDSRALAAAVFADSFPAGLPFADLLRTAAGAKDLPLREALAALHPAAIISAAVAHSKNAGGGGIADLLRFRAQGDGREQSVDELLRPLGGRKVRELILGKIVRAILEFCATRDNLLERRGAWLCPDELLHWARSILLAGNNRIPGARMEVSGGSRSRRAISSARADYDDWGRRGQDWFYGAVDGDDGSVGGADGVASGGTDGEP